ncbi:MAG TPA: glycosyltransferase family 39 protein [Verrucomicrobiae bacterium]|jgi:4-amino-4-deoxy-L-arabinose transferase-like glycosyltransferase|nr:glycosyltransferase family 39 protein [Verrucomicrobiae bacterium]
MAAPQPQARATPRGVWFEWFAQHPAWLLALVTVAVLFPFAGKPFNIDDPLFVWIARHIQSHPTNPYGFNVNWYGYDWPLWDITKNPPLACYYLAAAGSVFGWSEMSLHAAFLLSAIAVVLGAHRLAVRFCQRPVLAAFLALFTPVFLVSSTTLMCDVLMLTFWVWAIVFWVEGTERKRAGYLAAAALLMALAALTKYFGACLLPLVAVWSLMRKRPLKEWLAWLALPVIALAAYQLATRALYGHGLLADAGKYATTIHGSSLLQSLLTALTFTGGCLAPIVFCAPLLWPRRDFLIGAIASLAITVILFLAARTAFPTAPGAGEILQILLWAAGGVGVLALTVADVYRRRDADSLLLACWLLGTFIFTAFFNWIVNGRSILPMTIPAAILVARRLEQRAGVGVKFSSMSLFLPAAAGAALAIWVTVADYFFATAQRELANAVHGFYGQGSNPSHRLWFQGHWGFQYYMEQDGATALDLQHLQLAQRDHIAMPSGNSNVYPLKEPVTELETFSVPYSFLTTMDKQSGAGFYASLWGPLPFAFGPGAVQSVTVFAYDPTGEVQKARDQAVK